MSVRSITERRGLALTGTAVLIMALACGDPYQHTNPYDPLAPVEIAITGPDTLFSLGELGLYVARITPSFPDTAVQWAADTVTIFAGDSSYVLDGSLFLAAGSMGLFQSINPPLEPATLTVAVEALIGQIDTTVSRILPPPAPQDVPVTIRTVKYRHSGFKSVVITQRVTRIQLRCPDTHACNTLSAGAAWSVWADGFDALGRQIVALTSSTANPAVGTPLATYVSRDTTIASVSPVGIRAATVTARKSGTTWIVATRNSLLDSLQLVVR
jgi:hypothetical protein